MIMITILVGEVEIENFWLGFVCVFVCVCVYVPTAVTTWSFQSIIIQGTEKNPCHEEIIWIPYQMNSSVIALMNRCGPVWNSWSKGIGGEKLELMDRFGKSIGRNNIKSQCERAC